MTVSLLVLMGILVILLGDVIWTYLVGRLTNLICIFNLWQIFLGWGTDSICKKS